MPRRAPSSSRSCCCPCSRRAPALCSTASSTPRSPTRAPDAASAWPRCARSTGPPDRLEREGDAFFAAIARAYDELARSEPQRIRVLDATRDPEQVLADALAAIADLPIGANAGNEPEIP